MIQVRGLTKRLGNVKALKGVDLEVAEGEKLAIFGPNGAGKTTLLRVVVGLLRPSAGTVTIDGRKPREVRSRLGYLGHESFLFGHLTAQENLEFYARLYGTAQKRALFSLDAVGMSHKRSAKVNDLSQGETQRVAFARAFLHDPSYLLLDEPFSNLDEPASDLVQSLLRRRGGTLLLVTHDRERANGITDRSILLDAGSIAAEARSAER